MNNNFHISRLIRMLRYMFLDAKFGSGYLGKKLKNIGMGDSSHGWHGAQSSDYDALSKMFEAITVRVEDVIVDVGCGRGRLFNFLLHNGFKNKLVGIEVDSKIANFTYNRLKKYKQVQVLIADIEEEDVLPTDGTIFYLFNPFTDRIVKKFSEQLINKIKSNHFKKKDRPIIVYYNCNERLYIFEKNSLWKIRKLGAVSHTGLQAAIIEPNV